MNMSTSIAQTAFSLYLRTGRRPRSASQGVELKFNPYHDPRDGRFTFAPGGPRSLRDVIVSHRRAPDNPVRSVAEAPQTAYRLSGGIADPEPRLETVDAVYRPDQGIITSQSISAGSGSRSNIRPFIVPMTLQQVFPGLGGQVVTSIIAPIDGFFDIQGPVREFNAAFAREQTNTLINQIRLIDPDYRFESLGSPQTLEGQRNLISHLAFERATAFLRTKGEVRPLQVETLRLMQRNADIAYEQGLKLLRAGKLKIRLSAQEALGNYVDQRVRQALRNHFTLYGIDSAGKGPVRVNRRENDSSGSELSFRRPDARIGNVAFDVTLSAKTGKTPQVQGFFRADFRPDNVIIIRPSQIGKAHTYLIPRPEAAR